MAQEYVYSNGEQAEAEFGLPAQVAGEELERIKAQHGLLIPATVVEEARPVEAVLHPAFEWQDPIAAEHWREHQASSLIRRVRVVPAEPEIPQVHKLRPSSVAKKKPEPLTQYDPLLIDVKEALSAMEIAQARVEALRDRANHRFDRRRLISAGVAINDLIEAQRLLEDARGCLEGTVGELAAANWEP